ncbi:TasA family protein [Geodermatophilus sp. SYSU D00867]
MKKIALAAAAMGGAALVAFGAGGTFAAFQDSEQATSAAGAGTLDLVLDAAPTQTAPKPLALNPGQSTTQAFWIANTGSLPGMLSADAVVQQNAENDCTEPERQVDGSCGTTTGGEFTSLAQATLLYNAAGTAEACKAATTGTPIAPSRSIDSWVADPAVVTEVAAGAKACVLVQVTLPPTAGNVVQGDTAEYRIDFSLVQKTQQATAPAV